MIGYIYIITNKVNGKRYIGKTYLDIEKRFKIHIADSKKEKIKNRPLYKAINKHGQENFSIDLLEECDNNLEKRETYWIKKLGTYKAEYNATLGGDGKTYFEHEDIEIINKYSELGTITKVAVFYGCDVDTIRKRLINNKIKTKPAGEFTKETCSKPVNLYNEIEQKSMSFCSTMDVARYIKESNKSQASLRHIAYNISKGCNKKISKAYGFVCNWKLL